MVRDWEDVIWAQWSIAQCTLLRSKRLLYCPPINQPFRSNDVQSLQQLTYWGLCHIFSFALVNVQTLAKHLHLASPCCVVWVIWSWQVLWDMAESGRVLFAGVREGIHWASWCQHLTSFAAGVWHIDLLAPWKLRQGLELGWVGRVQALLLLE